MMYIYKILLLILILPIFTSCAEKKLPPLPGVRINVLHYDLQKEESETKTPIHIQTVTNLLGWDSSDANQYNGLPYNISLPEKLALKKKFSPSKFKPSGGDSAVMIVDGILYSYAKSTLSAYNLSSNETIWSSIAVSGSERNDVLSGSMAYNQGKIFLSSGGRDFIAFDSLTGKELWRYKSHNVIRHIPTIKGDKIYISTIDNTLSCLNMYGAILWRYDAPVYSLTSNHLYAPTLIYNDKVITATTAGDLIILNNVDGDELTQVNLATSSIIGDGSLEKGPIMSPLLDGSNLYLLTGESDLIKIDLNTPEILWRQTFPGAKSLWLTKDTTYLVTETNQLLALTNTTGKLLWAIDLPKDPKNKKLHNFYGPIMANNKLIITANTGEFFTFSPSDGSLISSYQNNFRINQIPIIVDSKMYFVGSKGEISIWQ